MSSTTQRNFKRIAIISGGIIVIAGLIGSVIWLLRGDPPIIIVKTGSLIFQSKKKINQTVSGDYSYTILNFGLGFRGIKIRNVSGTAPDIVIDDKNGKLEVDLTLQKKADLGDDVLDSLSIREEGDGSLKNLVIKSTVDLDQKFDSPTGYPDHWENSENYKFKSIIVRKKGIPQPTPDMAQDEDYAICIYNTTSMEDCK